MVGCVGQHLHKGSHMSCCAAARGIAGRARKFRVRASSDEPFSSSQAPHPSAHSGGNSAIAAQRAPAVHSALERRVLTASSRGMTLSISIDSSAKPRTAEHRGHKHAYDDDSTDYSRETIVDVASTRTGWLVVFCIGLLLAALVVEQFEDILEHHVELSFFVPLIMGHGGNTGSQSVTTVIRALALKQVSNRDIARVVLKEAGAGCLMGSVLGLCILAFSFVWGGISVQVGATVAMALPLVSLWANGLGAFLTMLADRLKFDPAVTSVPFMTTIVDSTGLVIYFYIAKWMLGISDAHP